MARIVQKSVVSPDRMFAAADVLLGAIDSPQGFDSCMAVHTGPLRNGQRPPPGLFIMEELVEAMAVLMRMGFVPTRQPRKTDHSEQESTRGYFQ